MPNLKRKNSDGTWQTITPASDFPAKVPIEVIDADLVPLSVTENGHYFPESPHNGFSDVTVNVPTGSDTPYGIINVTYPSGSTCTCTKGSIVLTASGTSGSYTFELPEFGTWTVACTDGSQSTSKTFNAEQPHTNIALSYGTRILNDNNWGTISEISAGGTAPSYWSVGDRKAITLNGKVGDGLTLTDYTTYVYIIGFNHNGATNTIDFGTFKTALTGGKDVCLVDSKYDSEVTSGTYFNMNSSQSNTNGWKGCRMRYYVLGSTNSNGKDAGSTTATSPVANTLMAAMPSTLRAVMKPMTIWTDNRGGGTDTASNVTSCVDYLPLLAEFEIFGERFWVNSAEQNKQKQYTYYTSGNSKFKYKHNSTSSAAEWWGRSPRSGNGRDFCIGNANGLAGTNYANYSIGVAPIFRV